MTEQSTADQTTFPVGMVTTISLAVLLVIILILGYAKRSGDAADQPKVARYGMIQDFSLTSQKNEPFTRKNVEDKVWIANFIFTSCATECPLLSRRMQDVQETFKNDPRVELVSISVDPRTDNPERLAKYADAYKAGDKWTFLTGDTKEIERLIIKGFMVSAPDELVGSESVRKSRKMLHSEKIAVVDQLGVVRFFANGMNPKAATEISAVVRSLLKAGS